MNNSNAKQVNGNLGRQEVSVYSVVTFDVRTVMSFGVHGMWLGEIYAGLTAVMLSEDAQMGDSHCGVPTDVIFADAFV